MTGKLELLEPKPTTIVNKTIVPDQFKDDVAALCEYSGLSELSAGTRIKPSLQEALGILPREKRRIDSYKSVVRFLQDEMGVTLIIHSQRNMKNNYFRKPVNSKSKTITPAEIQLPIQLTQARGSNLWTWEYEGKQMRNHFASGFWYSQNGENVFWEWNEFQSHTITIIKTVDILKDANGRQYVKVKRKGEQTWKQYLDEAVCICFHGRTENPNQRVNHKDGNIYNCDAENLEWE